MKIVITGGTGFLGLLLARKLIARGKLTGASGAPEPIDGITLFDVVAPPDLPADLQAHVKVVTGDIADEATVRKLVTGESVSVFHFASVLSGGAEQDFNLALRVNLVGGTKLLEACRALPNKARFVFTSSMAVYGGDKLPETVTDETKITPKTTYGMTKAALELLVTDYTRKGFLDGRGARLPTIIVRPGKPNKAASGHASGVFREPLSGVPIALPVGPDIRMVVGGYRSAVEGMIQLHELPPAALGHDRTINFPSLSVTVAEMMASLKRVAAGRTLGAVSFAPDPAIVAICRSWPAYARADRALALGLPRDADLDSIVRAYIEDFVER
ncbi:MAG: NAD-dependent epimerase/dehydratase family protein [Alphaproteobacteria bacterium]|nr:NAD-dependent epimerase/dehydratase family protein [Alphaproteobacteria bacterium]